MFLWYKCHVILGENKRITSLVRFNQKTQTNKATDERQSNTVVVVFGLVYGQLHYIITKAAGGEIRS